MVQMHKKTPINKSLTRFTHSDQHTIMMIDSKLMGLKLHPSGMGASVVKCLAHGCDGHKFTPQSQQFTRWGRRCSLVNLAELHGLGYQALEIFFQLHPQKNNNWLCTWHDEHTWYQTCNMGLYWHHKVNSMFQRHILHVRTNTCSSNAPISLFSKV